MSWEFVSFSEVCDIQGGTQPPKNQWITKPKSDYIRMLQIRDFTQPKESNIAYVKKSKSLKTCNSNDILIGRYGASIGKILTGLEGAYNVAIVKTIPCRELFSGFLLHYLRSTFFQNYIKSVGSRAAQAGFNKGDLVDLKIPLPPLDEQKRIAAILDKADQLRNTRRQAIAECDEFLKSTFIEMFGDPVINPKGWGENKLKDICHLITNGTTPKGGKKVYVNKGITFFRSQNVWKNKLELDDIVYIDEKTHSTMQKSSLKYGDLLMTKTGRFNTDNSSLGRTAMFSGETNGANINGHVYLIRLNENVVNEFVLFILTTDAYRDYIRNISVGGIDKRQINKSHLEKFPIINPPIYLQQKFAEAFNQIESIKSKMLESQKELDDNFNSLMQRAFKGEL